MGVEDSFVDTPQQSIYDEQEGGCCRVRYAFSYNRTPIVENQGQR